MKKYPILATAALVALLSGATLLLQSCGGGQPQADTSGTTSTMAGTTPGQLQPSLRDLADGRGFQVGTALLEPVNRSMDPRYGQIISGQFNRLEIENFSWDFLRPSQGSYDFGFIDHMVNYAASNNMSVEGHHLVWGDLTHLPAWLKDGNFTRDQLISILHDHVTTVVSRYRGKVQTWSVVNEAVSRQLLGADFWYNHIGPDYIAMVFQWAHDADPDAKLMLNEGENEDRSTPARQKISDGMYQLVAQLKQQGVPIDEVGMQMHILQPLNGVSQDTVPAEQDVIANMQRFASLGVTVEVTEFDVNLSDVPGSTDQRLAYEGGVYHDMLDACLQSGVCHSFSTFGFTDAITWYGDCPGCLNLPDALPLPFDAQYQPKPAYFAMRDALLRP